MNRNEIISYYTELLRANPFKSEAVAAIETLIKFIKSISAETIVELRETLKNAISILVQSEEGRVTAIASGCELFLRFITLTSLDHPDFQECKHRLIDRGDVFLKRANTCKQKIAKLGHPFIEDGATVLIHSRSRVVLQVLQEAARAKKRFTAYVTEAQPDCTGIQMAKDLRDAGIPTIVILDAAVSYIMEKVDLVLVGAEGVCESGGIINKLGTFGMALAAREMNKPLYVVAESFKFTRYYPLNQKDIPDHFKFNSSLLQSNSDLSSEHPMVDYTPPHYITLLFTDLGILTPSAVSDELIKLYL